MLASPTARSAAGRKRFGVLVVEDHPMVLEGMHCLLSETPDLGVCADATTPEEALAAMERERPDVVCLDLTLKDGADGFPLIEKMCRIDPEARILVLTAREEKDFAERCMQAGALGFMMKSEANETLVSALREVAQGRFHVSRRITTALLEQLPLTAPGRRQLETLTDREMEVFELIGRGWSTRQIGERLRIGFKTVESHRENIKNKLGLPHSAALMCLATKAVQGAH